MLLYAVTSMTVSPMPQLCDCEYYDRNQKNYILIMSTMYSKHLIQFSSSNGDWVGTVHYYSDCVWYNYYITDVDYNETTS